MNNIDLLDQPLKSDTDSSLSHFFTREISILALFPQSSTTPLINRDAKFKILQLTAFIINEIIEAFESFHVKKKLFEFDPHVGDTLCQIRAYQILLIFQNSIMHKSPTYSKLKLINLAAMREAVNQCMQAFTELIQTKGSRYNKLLDKVETLEDFIKNNHLSFNLSNELFLLIQARVLALFSIVDANGISRGIDYTKICLKAILSKTFAKRFMHCFQKNIAALSCEFIFKLLAGLETDYFKNLKLILPYLQVTDADGRSVLPCYEVTHILLAHILANRQALLVIVEPQSIPEVSSYKLLFVPNKTGTNFELQQNLHCYLTEPCIVVRGTTSYSQHLFISNILSVGLINVILANMAKHPQYSAQELSFISDNPYQYLLADRLVEKNLQSRNNVALPMLKSIQEINAAAKLESELLSMKALAEQRGCHMANPKLFLVKHIFCDVIANQTGKSSINYEPDLLLA